MCVYHSVWIRGMEQRYGRNGCSGTLLFDLHPYIHTYMHAYIHTYIHTYIYMCVCVSLESHVVQVTVKVASFPGCPSHL